MFSREWIWMSFILCNLIIFSFNTLAQSPFSHACDSLYKRIDTLNHSTLEDISISAYKVFKSFPQKDTSNYVDLHQLLHVCATLETQPDIRGRLLAQRIRMGIDQAVLMHTYFHRKLPSESQDLIYRFLFENETTEAVALAYKNTYELEEVTGISHGWAISQLHFPSPKTELQMTKLLFLGRLIQEVQAQKIRKLIRQFKGTNSLTESYLRASLLLNRDNLSKPYKELLIGSVISLERLYEVNIFHLLYPFIGNRSFFKEELPHIFMAAAHHENHHQETLEIIQTLAGSWLKILNIDEINTSQVKQLLLATPLTGKGEELEFLASLGNKTFPHFEELLQESNNRLLLARIIHVLINIPEDNSEIIPAIRAKLFELYFLYKGEFLSTTQLTKEFSTMSLLEGGELMLLLLSDQDQKIRLSALKRLAEIGDVYTYKKLKQVLLYTNYGVEKKTIKQAEASLDIMYDRLIPPDPLEISLSSPILEGQSLNQYSVVADKLPQFPGGRDALNKFLAKRTKAIRKHPLEGIIMLKFVVDTKGSLSDIQIVKSLHPLYDQRAISIVQSMPKWLPGMKNGKPIAVSQHLMIAFKR